MAPDFEKSLIHQLSMVFFPKFAQIMQKKVLIKIKNNCSQTETSIQTVTMIMNCFCLCNNHWVQQALR